jgi:hypothetical protein
MRYVVKLRVTAPLVATILGDGTPSLCGGMSTKSRQIPRPEKTLRRQKTRNEQQCRRRKGLMRNTAMSCFPTADKTQEREGSPAAVQRFWPGRHRAFRRQKTRNEQQCRRRKGLMRNTAMSCFPTADKTQEREGSPAALQRFWPRTSKPRAIFKFGIRNFCVRRRFDGSRQLAA